MFITKLFIGPDDGSDSNSDSWSTDGNDSDGGWDNGAAGDQGNTPDNS